MKASWSNVLERSWYETRTYSLMKWFMKCTVVLAFAACTVLVLIRGAAFADAAGTFIIRNQSPVTLQSCEAFSEKIVHTWSGKLVPFGKLSPFDVDDRNRVENAYHLGTSFVNESSVTASDVRVNFIGYDAFGERLAATTATYSGEFTTGALIERTKTGALETVDEIWHHNLTKVECRVDAVKFSDGSLWRQTDENRSGSDTKSQNDAVLNTRVRSITTYSIKLGELKSVPENQSSVNPLLIKLLGSPYIHDEAHLFSERTLRKLTQENIQNVTVERPIVAVVTLPSMITGVSLHDIQTSFGDVDVTKNSGGGILIFIVADTNMSDFVWTHKIIDGECKQQTMYEARSLLTGLFAKKHYDDGINAAFTFLEEICGS